MIALEKMRRVDVEATKIPSVDSWKWTPRVQDTELLRENFDRINASGQETSKQTIPGQWDHGEWK